MDQEYEKTIFIWKKMANKFQKVFNIPSYQENPG